MFTGNAMCLSVIWAVTTTSYQKCIYGHFENFLTAKQFDIWQGQMQQSGAVTFNLSAT